ncbi:MAG: alpha/beta fold hydrolase, partial [Pseudomonadota bacterium]
MTARPRRHPVVLIHGAFCAGWAMSGWKSVFESAGYACAAPDLPHHAIDWPAESPDPNLSRLGLKAYTDHILHECEALEDNPILIGHSLGGLIAQLAAARRPVAAIILLAPSAPWGVMPTSLREALTPAAMSFLAGPYWLKPILPDFTIACESCFNRVPTKDQGGIFDGFVPESGLATFETWQWAWDLRRSSWAAPHAVDAPMLILSGRDDRVNPPSTAAKIGERYPAA